MSFPHDISDPEVLHASAVAMAGRGALIVGPTGSGKSELALTLMAYGAELVADDRVEISMCDGMPWLSAPDTIRDRIEARGVGILNAQSCPGVHISVVVDLDTIEHDRLPERRCVTILGHSVPLVRKPESTLFAAAILQFLKAGRHA